MSNAHERYRAPYALYGYAKGVTYPKISSRSTPDERREAKAEYMKVRERSVRTDKRGSNPQVRSAGLQLTEAYVVDAAI